MSIFAVIDDATNICDNVVSWDDAEHPWTPPTNHYVINIDGLSVGIDWSYDPATSAWIEPPFVEIQANLKV